MLKPQGCPPTLHFSLTASAKVPLQGSSTPHRLSLCLQRRGGSVSQCWLRKRLFMSDSIHHLGPMKGRDSLRAFPPSAALLALGSVQTRGAGCAKTPTVYLNSSLGWKRSPVRPGLACPPARPGCLQTLLPGQRLGSAPPKAEEFGVGESGPGPKSGSSGRNMGGGDSGGLGLLPLHTDGLTDGSPGSDRRAPRLLPQVSWGAPARGLGARGELHGGLVSPDSGPPTLRTPTPPGSSTLRAGRACRRQSRRRAGQGRPQGGGPGGPRGAPERLWGDPRGATPALSQLAGGARGAQLEEGAPNGPDRPDQAGDGDGDGDGERGGDGTWVPPVGHLDGMQARRRGVAMRGVAKRGVVGVGMGRG